MDISKAKCPECGKPMTPVVCLCGRCNVRIEGEFEVSPLARLSSDEQALAIAFIRSYGSIKSLQEALGVSYPTARNRLEALVSQLDRAMAPPGSGVENTGQTMGDSLRRSLEPLKDIGKKLRRDLEPLKDVRRHIRDHVHRHVKGHVRKHAGADTEDSENAVLGTEQNVRRAAEDVRRTEQDVRRTKEDVLRAEEEVRRAAEVLGRLEAGEIDVKQALEEL